MFVKINKIKKTFLNIFSGLCINSKWVKCLNINCIKGNYTKYFFGQTFFKYRKVPAALYESYFTYSMIFLFCVEEALCYLFLGSLLCICGNFLLDINEICNHKYCYVLYNICGIFLLMAGLFANNNKVNAIKIMYVH